jgi:hypothetical protein
VKNASVLLRALVYGAILTGTIAIAGSLIGYLASGLGGLLSALVGAALTAVFMGFTTLSILIAQRATRGRPSNARYFSIVIGAWLFKFVVVIMILVAVQGQDWVNPYALFFTLIATVIGSLVTDIVALQGARVPYVGAS